MSATHFVVERLGWRRTCFHRDRGDAWVGYVLLPGAERRLRSFDDRDEAQRFCHEQEQALRARANPFVCGGPALHYQSSFDEGRLHDWLLDGGIDPPGKLKSGKRAWGAWWAGHALLTPEQREHVWKALDKVSFHRVVERPARPRAYVLLAREWAYDDEVNYTREDGVSPVEAYSTWEKAEKARARLEAQGGGGFGGYEKTGLVWERAAPFEELPGHGDLFAEPEEVQFYEIVEVDLEG
jgi:hypothetical protein